MLKDALRALVPAALFDFSACNSASALNASNSALIFSINSVIIKLNKNYWPQKYIFHQTILIFFIIKCTINTIFSII